MVIMLVADVCSKDVWDLQAFSQTFFELQFSLGNEGKEGKNLSSQTRPGSPRRLLPDICDHVCDLSLAK